MKMKNTLQKTLCSSLLLTVALLSGNALAQGEASQQPAVSSSTSKVAEQNMTIVKMSPFDFASTREHIIQQINALHLTLFAELDHAAAARANGLEMPNTTVLVFGNPKGGTPLMLAHPSLALDLPYRVLIAEQPDGKVQVSYPAAESFRKHQLNDQQIAGLSKLSAVIEAALQP